MAKYETRLRGDFDETLRYLHDGILDKSASASYEDESCVQNRVLSPSQSVIWEECPRGWPVRPV